MIWAFCFKILSLACFGKKSDLPEQKSISGGQKTRRKLILSSTRPKELFPLRRNTKHLPSRQLNGLCAVLLKNTGRRKLLSLTKTSRDISNWETRQLNYSRIGNY